MKAPDGRHAQAEPEQVHVPALAVGDESAYRNGDETDHEEAAEKSDGTQPRDKQAGFFPGLFVWGKLIFHEAQSNLSARQKQGFPRLWKNSNSVAAGATLVILKEA